MSDFIDRLEADLLEAAGRRPRTRRAGATRRVRWSRRSSAPRLIVSAAVALAFATPALAGVGLWGGILAGRTATFTRGGADPRVLAEIGALRSPPDASDHSPAAVAAATVGNPLSGVSSSGVRYVGDSPLGARLYLVPFRSEVKELDFAPAGTSVSAAVRRERNKPGVCLVGVSSRSVDDIDDCALISEIMQGDAYATDGILAAAAGSRPAPGAGRPFHVTATLASGIVPDGVASVELIFRGGRRLALPVHDNYFAFLGGSGEGGIPTIVWRAGDGQAIRRVPPD